MQIHNSDVYTYSSLQKGRVCVFSFSRSHMSNLQILIPWGRKRAGHDSATKQQDAAQSCLILCDPMDCSLPVSSVHGIFPGNNTGVGNHFLLQGIFPTQGSNPVLPHYRQTPYCLSRHRSEQEGYLVNTATCSLHMDLLSVISHQEEGIIHIY